MIDDTQSPQPTNDLDDVSRQPPPFKFSDDLANYIRTGVDPTGRYAKPPTQHEKAAFACGYLFLIVMFLTGLLSGVGRHLL